jgi:hypothetical protein
MARAAKVRHNHRIISRNSIALLNIKPGDIIEFAYAGEGVKDTRPLVFVLFEKEHHRGDKMGKSIKLKRAGNLTGINLNYLPEFRVSKLLTEFNFVKMKYYSLYKNAFRTYDVSKMKNIKYIEYQSEAMDKPEKQIEKMKGEYKKPKEPEKPKEPKIISEMPKKPSEPMKPIDSKPITDTDENKL